MTARKESITHPLQCRGISVKDEIQERKYSPPAIYCYELIYTQKLERLLTACNTRRGCELGPRDNSQEREHLQTIIQRRDYCYQLETTDKLLEDSTY